MITFFHLLLLTLSKENPIKFAYLWIDQSYLQPKEKENDEHYTKLCKDMFKKACNSFSSPEKDQCDSLFNSFLGVFVSDLNNAKQKICEIQKKAKFLYINGRPIKIDHNFNKLESKMAVRLDTDESLSLVNRIQKTVNKTVSDMIKPKFKRSKLSFHEPKQANRIKRAVKENNNENFPEIKYKRRHGSHSNGNGSKTSAIIGIVIACIIAVIIIIVIICYCMKKKKSIDNSVQESNENKNHFQNQQNYPPQQQYQPQYNYQNQQNYPPQQYPQHQNYPNHPYANPTGCPDQNYYPNQNYSYPNQSYPSQPYADQAIPVQPYENAHYNQFQGRDVAYRESDTSEISDKSD